MSKVGSNNVSVNIVFLNLQNVLNIKTLCSCIVPALSMNV